MLQDEDMKMTMTAMKTMTTTDDDDDGTSKIESGAIYPQRVGKRSRGAELSCGRGHYARSFHCPLSLGRSYKFLPSKNALLTPPTVKIPPTMDLDGWMLDGWMDGWLHGCMDGCMDAGWLDGCCMPAWIATYIYIYIYS